MSILSSFNWLTSWLSQARMPSGKSAATTPAAVNEVSLPYMAMPGRPARAIAIRIIETSPLTAAISHGDPGLGSLPLMVDKTPLTMASTNGSRA
jgi:hypothetical protein